MKKIEGSYCCYDGLFVTQCSVWNIVSDEEDELMRELIEGISKRNRGTVKVAFFLEREE